MSREDDFNSLLDAVIVYPRPRMDYGKLYPQDFLEIQFLSRILTIQTAYMILLRSGVSQILGFVPGGDKITIENDVIRWVKDVTPKMLRETYCVYPDAALFALHLDLQIEERFFLIPEFVRRLEDKPLASETLLLEVGYDRELNLEQLLHVDKIKSYRLRDYDENDIRQESKARVFEILKDWGATLSVKRGSPLPSLPGEKEGLIKMFPAEKEFWQGPMARAWKNGREAVLRGLVPRFEGEAELIPEKVRRHNRNEWETIVRREAILADPSVQDEMRRRLHESADRNIIHDLRLVLRRAEKRWGAKAAIAFRYHAEGKTQEEAAKAAGIGVSTFKSYILKLSKEFSKKR